jgi:hypothetical protein
MNASSNAQTEPTAVGAMRTRLASRLRFHTWHLLAFMACIAIAISTVNVVARTVGYTSTTVEIIKYHSSWEPRGSIEFLVQLPNGFSQSAVAVRQNASSIDYSKLVGTKYTLRYRPRRILWFAPENAEIAAFRLVETEVDQFATREGTRTP